MPTAAPIVRVMRSGVEESIHLGHVVVCDPEGRVLAALGDPDRLVFSRSSMKPLQAAVSLRRISEPLPEDLVAVMCASHNGEPVHVRTVRRLLRLGDRSERDLGCPPDLPIEREARRSAARPRRVYHNCSGKHAGMLVACQRSGLELDGYLRPAHPLQREIVRAVRSATGRRSGWTDAARPSMASRCAGWRPCSHAYPDPSASVDSAKMPLGRWRACERLPTSSPVAVARTRS